MSTAADPSSSIREIEALGDLLRLLCRSLPAYLADAKPWTQSDDLRLRSAIERLVADQRRYAGMVAEAIVARGARPDPGRFPMNFTAKNDLSLEYLVRESIDHQRRSLSALRRCAARLEGDPSLHSLAEEILGNARGHLDIILETTGDKGLQEDRLSNLGGTL